LCVEKKQTIRPNCSLSFDVHEVEVVGEGKGTQEAKEG